MSKGIDTNNMDTTISPADDFYLFVNGGWLSRTEIPDDRSSWGSFHELAKNTDAKILSILEQELAQPGQAENKAARVFESGMDLQQIEKVRTLALLPLFHLIENVTEKKQIPALLGGLIRQDMGGLIQFTVHPDLGNSKQYACYLEPSMTGLPEREYYLDEDDKAVNIRNAYQQYIRHISNESHVKEFIRITDKEILHLETQLANATMIKEDRRDIAKIYNPCTIEQLKEKFPLWNWDSFFEGMGINLPTQVIITDPGYFEFFNSWISTVDLDTIKGYLFFMLIHQAAPFAQKELEDAHFEMYAKTIEGIPTMRPRKERVIKVINNLLGEALGELFVSKYFPIEAKHTAMEMVEDIITAYGNRIRQLQWMSEKTKSYALEKLAAIRIKIGYPDVWKKYDDLVIQSEQESSSYLQNIMAAAAWKKAKDLERIGRDVDKEEWFMAPQIVNAYYNPLFNEIVFPAAILQPPFFDWEADAATNYGGIGAVIGHEITHGFDDQGSRFDKEGNYKEWWTESDRQQFNEQTQKLVLQFDAYYPFEDLALNGAFTLGENIADLGGLSVAYDALQLYYSRHGRPEKTDGFDPEQRFFISWATVWRTKIRPEALRNQIKTDPHPPGRYRAVAAPSNMDTFYEAFEVVPTSPWYRKSEERIKIW